MYRPTQAELGWGTRFRSTPQIPKRDQREREAEGDPPCAKQPKAKGRAGSAAQQRPVLSACPTAEA
ncbi:hypothetical protein GCM10011586_25350 [Silvibacterium dinghuense]|nr:hypothetical protein GCM10011586_25350 [Silvibacterium dinghuense]